MRLTHVHRILEFTQHPWIKTYIDFNTDKRRQATMDFERDFYKLMNNSVFGKTMENLQNCVNINRVNDQTKAKKMIASPTFKHLEIINPELVMIRLSQNSPKLTHLHRFIDFGNF